MLLDDLLPRVRALPGVAAAGLSNMVPLGSATALVGFTVSLPGRTPVTARGMAYRVSAGYAEALGLRLRAGRLLTEPDAAAALQPLVINDKFVATFLSGVDPIGVRFPSPFREGATAEIVGVVANVLKEGLDADPQPEVYVGLSRDLPAGEQISLVVRAEGDLAPHVTAVRQLLRELRPGAVLDTRGPLEAQIASSVAQPRFAAWVLATFAVLGSVLSAVGLYSVLAYTMSRRQRELGVRAALGATRADIVALVCRDGMLVAGLGVVIGLAAAAALGRLMQGMLFGIDALDLVSFSAAPLVLLMVAIAACLMPAYRAAATDPSIALRCE